MFLKTKALRTENVFVNVPGLTTKILKIEQLGICKLSDGLNILAVRNKGGIKEQL